MEDLAEAAIDHALKLGAEFADLRIESARGMNILVMDGKTKALLAQREAGCGIRVFMGGAWGFASTNLLTASSLKSAAASAVKMAKVARSKVKIKFEIGQMPAVRTKEEYRCKEKPSDVTVEEKLSFAMSLDKSMGSTDGKIVSRSSRYDDLQADWVVANSFGTLVRMRELWVLAACAAWSRSEGVTQRGYASVGSVGGYELMRSDRAERLGSKAAAQAIRLLDSKPVPAGKFTVIIDNNMTGVLAHEAFGHACEADAVLAGSSVLEGRIGQKVAGEGITLVDDPTIKDTFGYFSTDWEGIKARRRVLVEKGVLNELLHNIETSSRMNAPANGSARSEGYYGTPIVRMSNTFIAPGEMKKAELFEGLKSGLLMQGMQYGYVEPAKGQFMFKCEEAYDIKNGEVGQRYRDASLSGVVLEVLNKVEGLADDFVFGDPGYCGKGGQSARVAQGGPHMRISDMVVGGLA